MFRSFFLSKQWTMWAWPGVLLIVAGTWYQVQVNVMINEWFGGFYDLVQKALGQAEAVSLQEYYGFILTFGQIAGIYVIVAVVLSFYTKHWVFRWRNAMNDFYMSHWGKLRHIEGASQRIQEDSRRFAAIVESLGASLLESVLTLVAFLPILWELSKAIKVVPFFGEVDHALVYIAIIFALFGTAVLAAVGIKLPGLEFNNQKVEAAYRKELVFGEDHEDRAAPPTVTELFSNVRRNYFRLFFHYMYFDVAKWSYLQFGVLVPYIALGPTIVGAAITLGVMQQIVRAFGQVESSFQFLVRSWNIIVELISVYKRLRAFELGIKEPKNSSAFQ
ncbi:MAG: transporter [Proteobacteria bacterium]|nr:transporter [Pseudomonadota bacterium]